MPLSLRLAGTPLPESNPATFTTILRDHCNDPIPNRYLKLEIGACGDFAFSADQDPGVTADCGLNTLTFSTDANGVATITPRGYVSDWANPSVAACANLYAENLPGESPTWVLLKTMHVASFDLDGVNGLSSHDLLNWWTDLVSGASPQRSDYDLLNGVNLIDSSILGAMLYTSGTINNGFTSSAPRCDQLDGDFGPIGNGGTSFSLYWIDHSADCEQTTLSTIRAFNCNSNSSPDQAMVSVTASSPITAYAVQAAFEIFGQGGSPIADWWNPTVCGGFQRLGASMDDQDGCLTFENYLDVTFPIARYPVTRIDRGTWTVTAIFNTPLSLSGSGIPLFLLNVNRQRTIGANMCAGCGAPIGIRLASLRFITSPPGIAPDVAADIATVTTTSNTIYYQGIPENPLLVTSASPKKLGQASQIVSIQGLSFVSGSTVKLRRTGESDISGSVQSVASNGLSMVATFDLTSAAAGVWDLEVTAPSSATATLPAAVTVEAFAPAQLKATLSGTMTRREGWNVTQTASFTNAGNAPYDGHAWFAYYVPLGVSNVKVTWAGKGVGSFTPEPADGFVGIFSVPNRPDLLAPYTFKFAAPAVGTYESRLELFSMSGPISSPLPADGMGTLAAQLIDAQATALSIALPSVNAAFAPAFATALDHALSTTIELFSRVGNPVASQARQENLLDAAVTAARQSSTLNSTDAASYGAFWSLVRGHADFRKTLPVTAAALPSPPRPDADYPKVYTLPLAVIGSADPNDKAGPAGVGAAHDIAGGTAIPYFIHFENMATATAPAQVVQVDDQLDRSTVDFSTLSLGTITFGDQVIQPPPGLQTYTEDVDLQPEHNLVARVAAAFDPETGLLTWRFVSLDPVTLLPTENSLEGFLPPNVNPGEGEGSVSFTVMPKATNPDGTVYPNFARIVFDQNPYIDTPVWSNRLDLSAPASAVTGLTSAQGALSFLVSWSGSDALSGIGDYSVRVSDNGGPYSTWQSHVTSTSATFTGVNGHTYAFYSVARDRVGNLEAAPGSPDASTTVTVGVDGTAPLPKRLALRTLGGHPSRGALRVELALPRVAAGKIEVLDIAGRVIESRDISRLEAGWHPLTLATVRSPGLYFVRVTHGAETVTLKSVQLR